MGYCIHYQFHQIQIPAEQTEAALQAIHALYQAEQIERHGTAMTYDPLTQVTTIRYRGADLPPEGGFATLKDALRAWSFETVEHSDGTIEIVAYWSDKAGDEAVLFDAIAPFVNSSCNAYINAKQDNDEYWKHTFRNGTHQILLGKVVYADECPEQFDESDGLH